MNLRYVEHRQHKKRKEPQQSTKVSGNWIKDQQVCMTGTFILPRRTVITMITDLGGQSVDRVSKSIDILIVSNTTSRESSKMSKARQYNIKIMRESEFAELWDKHKNIKYDNYKDFI